MICDLFDELSNIFDEFLKVRPKIENLKMIFPRHQFFRETKVGQFFNCLQFCDLPRNILEQLTDKKIL